MKLPCACVHTSEKWNVAFLKTVGFLSNVMAAAFCLTSKWTNKKLRLFLHKFNSLLFTNVLTMQPKCQCYVNKELLLSSLLGIVVLVHKSYLELIFSHQFDLNMDRITKIIIIFHEMTPCCTLVNKASKVTGMFRRMVNKSVFVIILEWRTLKVTKYKKILILNAF